MTDVLIVRNKYRTQARVALIPEYNNGGLTKRDFCRPWGIPEKSF